MNIKIGDIYLYPVYYPMTGETEVRPVVVLDFDEDNPVIATITSSPIENFDNKYDEWQVPLFHWLSSGLDKGSYVKANCVATVDIISFEPKKYIGKIHRNDFKNVKKGVEEFINSGEEPW